MAGILAVLDDRASPADGTTSDDSMATGGIGGIVIVAVLIAIMKRHPLPRWHGARLHLPARLRFHSR